MLSKAAKRNSYVTNNILSKTNVLDDQNTVTTCYLLRTFHTNSTFQHIKTATITYHSLQPCAENMLSNSNQHPRCSTVPYLKVPGAYYVLTRYKSSDRDMLPLPIHKVKLATIRSIPAHVCYLSLYRYPAYLTQTRSGIYTNHNNSTQDL